MIVIRIRLKASQENEEALVNYLKGEVQKNKTLAGCLTYSLYKDLSEANALLIYEEWDCMESFESYKNSEGFREIMKALSPLLAGRPDSAHFDSVLVGP